MAAWTVPVHLLFVFIAAVSATFVANHSCILDPTLPSNLTLHADVQPICAGFIDPTMAPFLAVGDGQTDDTDAIQAALEAAYLARMAVLLPSSRTYVVSKQIHAIQRGRPAEMREFGYQLVGARGDSPPVLKVMDNVDAANFPSIYSSTNPNLNDAVARPLIVYALDMSGSSNYSNDAPSHYSALLRNIDIDLGHNPALSGVAMSGAQLCSIEDVRVYGSAFVSGFVGIPGSGGFSANLEVTGGKFAVWQQQYRPNPSITGLLARNQTVAGVLLENSRGPLVLSGFSIRSAAAQFQAGIWATAHPGGDGALALEDGVISLESAVSPAIVSAGSDISLKQVLVRASVAIAVKSSSLVIKGSAGAYKQIPRWSFSAKASIAVFNGTNATVTRGYPGLDLPSSPAHPSPKDSDLMAKHSWTRAWAQTLSWTPDPATMLDVVRDCGATPEWVNHTDDDGVAIAACLARQHTTHSVVFVPRGTFLLFHPLVLRPGQRLVGAGKHCASLEQRPSSEFDSVPFVLIDNRTTTPLREEEVPGLAVLSDLVLTASQRGTLLEVDAPSIVRDMRTTPCSSSKHSTTQPRCTSGLPRGETATEFSLPIRTGHGAITPGVVGVRFGSSASGRFYGLSLDHFSDYLVPGDALLALNNTQPLTPGVHLYQLSAEHLPTNYQVQVWRSANVHFHAFKFESSGFKAHPTWGKPGGGLFSCHSSQDVSVFGGSGNFGIMNGTLARDIIFAWGCTAFRVDALVRKPQDGELPDKRGAHWLRYVRNSAEIVIGDKKPALLMFTSD